MGGSGCLMGRVDIFVSLWKTLLEGRAPGEARWAPEEVKWAWPCEPHSLTQNFTLTMLTTLDRRRSQIFDLSIRKDRSFAFPKTVELLDVWPVICLSCKSIFPFMQGLPHPWWSRTPRPKEPRCPLCSHVLWEDCGCAIMALRQTCPRNVVEAVVSENGAYLHVLTTASVGVYAWEVWQWDM